MLGLLASLVRGHDPGLQLALRRLRANAPGNWDDDLSDWDLETLAKAGWSEEKVREHVEAVREMISVLTQVDSGEPGSDYVSPDRGEGC